MAASVFIIGFYDFAFFKVGKAAAYLQITRFFWIPCNI